MGPRTRRFLCAGAALLAVLALAGPAAGAQPSREVIELDNPVSEAEVAAFLTEECGTEIEADLEGRITVLVFDNPVSEGLVEHNIYEAKYTFTNPETGAVFSLHDAGPDTWFVRDGTRFLASSGRSTTGTGVIGRVVRDADTRERVFEAGKPVGDFVERVCDALT